MQEKIKEIETKEEKSFITSLGEDIVNFFKPNPLKGEKNPEFHGGSAASLLVRKKTQEKLEETIKNLPSGEDSNTNKEDTTSS